MTLSARFWQNNLISSKVTVEDVRCMDVFSLFLTKRANLFKLTFSHVVLHKFELKYCAFWSSWRFLFFFHETTLFQAKSQLQTLFVYNFHLKQCIDVFCLFLTKQANLGKFTVPIAVLRKFELKPTDVLFHWVFFFPALFCQNKPIST